MSFESALEKCSPFINSQFVARGDDTAGTSEVSGLAVTISRQTGSGAHAVAEHLALFLHAREPRHLRPWAIFDRNLAETVLQDHDLPPRLVQFMPEDRVLGVNDAIDELLAGHPPSWLLVRQTAETVLRLALKGNVILIGRGGNVITQGLRNVFHVRLVASLDKRIEHIQEIQGLGSKAARDLILREDRGRRRYLQKYFRRDVDDPLLYHMVINTDLMSYEETANTICDAALRGFDRLPAPEVKREPEAPSPSKSVAFPG